MANLSTPITGSSLIRPTTFRDRLDLPRRTTLVGAGFVVVLVVLLLGFITWNGVQLFTSSGIRSSRSSRRPGRPMPARTTTFGLLPFILGTLGVMVVAAIIAAPLSIGLALFMSEIAPHWARSITRPAMEVFVGIPSVVYGLARADDPGPVPARRTSTGSASRSGSAGSPARSSWR